MFNGSSNIIIKGGTFIVVNCDGHQADSTSQSTAADAETHNSEGLDPMIVVRTVCRIHGTRRSPHRSPHWETNAQNYSEPETYPTVGRRSTMSFGTSVHDADPEPCPMPMPTISRESSLQDENTFPPTPVMSVGASGGTTTANNGPPSLPFPMPEFNSRPLQATHAQHFSTFPEPEHFPAAVDPAPSPSHHPIRASTWS